MIYTQRPNATACAEFDLWTQYMRRHIRRGSRGIALLTRRRDGRPALRYVFDITGTESREDSRDPVIWQYQDEYEQAVTARLAECFRISGDKGLADQLIGLAVQFTEAYWQAHKNNIMDAVHGSGLDKLDEDGVSDRFCAAMTASLAFLLLTRCGFDLDSYFTPEDFACIGGFDIRDTVLALGNAVSASAGAVLRQIEYAIKQQMRSPKKESISENTAAGTERPAAVPVSEPEPETPPVTASEPPQEAPEQPEATPADVPEQLEIFTLPIPPVQEPPAQPEPVRPSPAPTSHNFRITDDDLGIGGPKAKFRMNADAIRVLKRLESEGRSATPDEQEIPSRPDRRSRPSRTRPGPGRCRFRHRRHKPRPRT